MRFEAVRHEGCFPELYGFVLLDPARLDDAMDGAAGKNLLDLFATTSVGADLARDGVLVPVFDVEAGYYTILVRDSADPSPWSPSRTASRGWILGTGTGELVVCGVGYLASWKPGHTKHRRVEVAPGWYRVEVRLHRDDEPQPNGDDGGYEFILTRTQSRPSFEADL